MSAVESQADEEYYATPAPSNQQFAWPSSQPIVTTPTTPAGPPLSPLYANQSTVQQQQQQQQQQRLSYYQQRSPSGTPPGAEGGLGGPVPVVEFPDDEVFRRVRRTTNTPQLTRAVFAAIDPSFVLKKETKSESACEKKQNSAQGRSRSLDTRIFMDIRVNKGRVFSGLLWRREKSGS